MRPVGHNSSLYAYEFRIAGLRLITVRQQHEHILLNDESLLNRKGGSVGTDEEINKKAIGVGSVYSEILDRPVIGHFATIGRKLAISPKGERLWWNSGIKPGSIKGGVAPDKDRVELRNRRVFSYRLPAHRHQNSIVPYIQVNRQNRLGRIFGKITFCEPPRTRNPGSPGPGEKLAILSLQSIRRQASNRVRLR